MRAMLPRVLLPQRCVPSAAGSCVRSRHAFTVLHIRALTEHLPPAHCAVPVQRFRVRHATVATMPQFIAVFR